MDDASLPQFRLFRDFSVSTSNFALGDDALEFESGMDESMQWHTICPMGKGRTWKSTSKSILQITSVFLVLISFIDEPKIISP